MKKRGAIWWFVTKGPHDCQDVVSFLKDISPFNSFVSSSAASIWKLAFETHLCKLSGGESLIFGRGLVKSPNEQASSPWDKHNNPKANPSSWVFLGVVSHLQTMATNDMKTTGLLQGNMFPAFLPDPHPCLHLSIKDLHWGNRFLSRLRSFLLGFGTSDVGPWGVGRESVVLFPCAQVGVCLDCWHKLFCHTVFGFNTYLRKHMVFVRLDFKCRWGWVFTLILSGVGVWSRETLMFLASPTDFGVFGLWTLRNRKPHCFTTICIHSPLIWHSQTLNSAKNTY